MASFLRPLVFSIIFIALGITALVFARFEQDLAQTGQLMATLQYGKAGQEISNKSPTRIFGDFQKRTSALRAMAAYWSGRYQDLVNTGNRPGADAPNPEEQLIASNAAYRLWEMQDRKVDRGTSVNQLDAIIQRYAEAMKVDSQNEDAAYNYEVAVRRRDSRGKTPATNPKKVETSIYGQLGAPPPGSDMNQFKVIVPQRPDERKEDEKAGQSERRTKKG